MDINEILPILVTISCTSLILRVLTSRQNWGWFWIANGILAVMGTFFWLLPEKAGLIGGVLWLTFVLIPILGLRQVNYWVYQESFRKARVLAALLSWLHPGDGWRDQPQFLRTLEFIKKGEIARAKTILDRRFQTSNYGFNYTAQALQFRMEANWEDCLNWIKNELSQAQVWQSPTIATIYLRSLGELGDLNGLIWTVKCHQSQLDRLGYSIPLNLARLYVFSFAGDVQAVQKLFQFPLKIYSRKIQQFWLATAQITSGQEQFGKNILYYLQPQDIAFKAAISYRLSHNLPEANNTLTPESKQIINILKKELQQEINYGGAVSVTPTKAHLTYSLMIINVLVFVVEISQGGSQNREVLYQLGAAVPEAIFSGEPWRILTANFLHTGYLHLVSNLLGLWILSPYVEFYLGWVRYLIVYLFSGVGAIYLFSDLAMLVGREDDLLVGASAAIMGLMGGTFIILWQGWQQEKSQIAKEKLQFVVLIIVLQTVFDFSMTNVSFLGHAFGLVLGMLITLVLLVFYQKKA